MRNNAGVSLESAKPRRVLDRKTIAKITGANVGTVDKWHREREHFGFPERAPGGGWYEDEFNAFWHDYQQQHAETLALVDHSGDPDELVGTTEAARVLHYNTRNDLPDTLRDLADETIELPSGRIRRKWRRRTLWNFADDHLDRKRIGRTTGPTQPQGQPDLTGDPNELVGSTEAARVTGYANRRCLPQHILDAADEKHTTKNGSTQRRWRRRTLWEALVS